jgi:hypothetical protein
MVLNLRKIKWAGHVARRQDLIGDLNMGGDVKMKLR